LIYVIYHSACYDGWGAAWVAQKCMPDAVLLPGLHGNPIPEVPDGALVYMIDISYPREQMEALAQRVSLRVLDHHKTAQAALEGFPNTVFDMAKSGAMLAWEEFFPGRPAPKLIDYIQDQDLWTWKMPDSEAICSYIRSYPRTVDAWDFVSESLIRHYTDCVGMGLAIMRSEAQRVEEMCEQTQWYWIDGYYVPVANATTQFSAVGNALCKKHPKAAFAAYYMDRGDGQRQWGLRSIGDFDVSAVAKCYGGGGHKNAAGFQTPVLQTFKSGDE
jgi:oligoribonuclease NrnB/cAMP/cGMP phosphodiesterase (DHH superfamily)